MNEDLKRIFIDTVTTYNFSDQEVEDTKIKEIYELTKWSPTSFNCSPLRLRFLKSKEAKERIDPCVMPFNREKVKNAPVCVILAMDIEFFQGTSIKSNILCNIGYGINPKGSKRGSRYEFDEVAEIL